MKVLRESIYYCLFGDSILKNEVNIEMPNHITVLSYFSKRVRQQSPEQQLSFHTDNIYGKDGRFDERKNSQGANTVTAILTLGDSREICFREYFSDSRDNQVGTNDMDIKILLSHKSLFILHPSNEMPMNRSSNTTKTFFKHGVPKFGGDSMLSCALIFRYTTRTVELNALTGKNKYDDSRQNIANNLSDNILNQYIVSDDCKKDHTHLKQLYLNMEKRYKT